MKIAPPDPRAAERLAALLVDHPQLRVRKMFGHPAAFANGNLCVGTYGRDLFVRLSDVDQRRAEALPGAHTFAPMAGRPMRGYVVLPPSVLADEKQASLWVDRSVRFAMGLPSKEPKGRRT